MSPRPNIVYVHTHDTGRWVSPYGHAVPTPHIQALAEDGVVFRQAFSAAPTCSPSRAALLTGQAPHSASMPGLAHRGFALHDERQHLLRVEHEVVEGHDLAADPAFDDVRRDLAARLHAWMVRTGDPLLEVPVPAPEGFWIDPDQVSAQVD